MSPRCARCCRIAATIIGKFPSSRSGSGGDAGPGFFASGQWLNVRPLRRTLGSCDGGQMPSLFLSYARGDMERIRPLAAALEQAGHDVWWDRHIAGGQEFSGAIEQALSAADAVIVCWSAQAIGSAWVRDEAAAGRDTGRLIPVSLDG